jgi:2-succinyl-5-enolpyruvyl-6-hydroxy-3-cyclohexene-1-carboxylate synthase
VIAYLDRITPQHHILVRANGVWADDSHHVTDFIQMDEAMVCNTLYSERGETDWTRQWRALEAANWAVVDEQLQGDAFDAAFIADLLEVLPDHTHLFVGNSLSIRHVDQFGKPSAKNLHVFGSRGASGIDGNVSTALGIASQTKEPLVLLVGDITFYHDMNGLFAVKNLDLNNVTIVLINNDGGGIFNRLPISGYEPAFTDLFIMPHGLQFEHAAKLYGLNYAQTSDRAIFRQMVSDKIGSGTPSIIEVRTDYKHDEQRRREVIAAVKQAVQAKMHTGETK